jgi:hypothetical protein
VLVAIVIIIEIRLVSDVFFHNIYQCKIPSAGNRMHVGISIPVIYISLAILCVMVDPAGYLVGRLFLSDLTGKYHFEYDDTFQSTGLELSPINLSLMSKSYEAQRNQDFYDLHGVFADSLQDDWGRTVQDLEFYKICGIPEKYEKIMGRRIGEKVGRVGNGL